MRLGYLKKKCCTCDEVFVWVGILNRGVGANNHNGGYESLSGIYSVMGYCCSSCRGLVIFRHTFDHKNELLY